MLLFSTLRVRHELLFVNVLNIAITMIRITNSYLICIKDCIIVMCLVSTGFNVLRIISLLTLGRTHFIYLILEFFTYYGDCLMLRPAEYYGLSNILLQSNLHSPPTDSAPTHGAHGHAVRSVRILGYLSLTDTYFMKACL